MYKIATAKITGLIDWVRPDVNKISVAGLEINLKQVDSMNANDLVEVHATLNEAGAWNGRIDMHLPLGHARKIEGNHNKTDDPAAKAATGTPSKPLPDSPKPRPSAPYPARRLLQRPSRQMCTASHERSVSLHDPARRLLQSRQPQRPLRRKHPWPPQHRAADLCSASTILSRTCRFNFLDKSPYPDAPTPTFDD